MVQSRGSRVLGELRPFTNAYAALFVFSAFNPILYFAAPLFAKQVFDRVTLSRNETTLWVLAVTAIFLIGVHAIVGVIRAKTLRRVGIAFDQKLTRAVFDALHRDKPAGQSLAMAAPLNDLNIVREFVSGPFVGALYDAVWSPLFIVALFLIHPVLGIACGVFIAMSAITTLINHLVQRGASKNFQRCNAATNDLGGAIFRNAESVRSLGMLPRLRDRWYALHTAALGWQSTIAARADIASGFARFLRTGQPIFIYTIGTLLYLNEELGLGSLMLATIVMMRGLGPIDYAIANWRMVSSFLAAKTRMDDLLGRQANRITDIALPRPTGSLVVSRLAGAAPGEEKFVLSDVSFAVQPGRVLGIIGPSGAGKSCLTRYLVGAWKPVRGSITLGDYQLDHWNQDDLGQHIGYMPQDIELLPGTVAENVTRFATHDEASSEKLLTAASNAGVHDIVKNLPDGLNTRIGFGGQVISGGQRQRLALARAIYGSPYLVVLDEPNSNLDSTGETALGGAIEKLRVAGAIVVVVSHKMSLISLCDDILVLNAGVVQAFGPRAQVIDRLPKAKSPTPLSIVGAEGRRVQ